jgi:hypothetical protein
MFTLCNALLASDGKCAVVEPVLDLTTARKSIRYIQFTSADPLWASQGADQRSWWFKMGYTIGHVFIPRRVPSTRPSLEMSMALIIHARWRTVDRRKESVFAHRSTL